MTTEAYSALKEYMDYSASYGESITGESWLIRDKWQTTDVKQKKISADGSRKGMGGRPGLATIPKKLPNTTIRKILERAYYTQDLREPLPEGKRRFEFKGAHGFRKFFKTQAETLVRSATVEWLIGHSMGISGSYYRP
jgi:hypothetical protein